jgi:DNA-binding transcriptional regulator LsrR (DeoR family)
LYAERDFAQTDYATARLMSRVLTLYYVDGHSQAQVARTLGLSTAKVNRLIKQARQQGMVEISIHTPYQSLLALESALRQRYRLQDAIVVPELSADPDTVLQSLGLAAADHLLTLLHDGDTLCISGGKAVQAVVQAVRTPQPMAVRVVPATGGVQGRHHSDVNFLATELADRLGGQALYLHAPIIVDTPAQRDGLLTVRQIADILDLARRARVALVGIGSIVLESSSYLELTHLTPDERQELVVRLGARGAVLARIYDAQGRPCGERFGQRIVGLSLAELQAIPVRLGVAAPPDKTEPLRAALLGHLLTHLVTDEATATQLLGAA